MAFYNDDTSKSEDIWRTFRRTLVVVAVLVIVTLFWIAHEVFLLLFAGLLFGILLDGLAAIVAKYSKLSRPWALTVTVLTLLFVTVAVVNGIAPGVGEQVTELQTALPRSIARLKDFLNQYTLGAALLANLPNLQDLSGEAGSLLVKLTGAVSATVNILIRVILVIVIGIFAAAEPQSYRGAFLKLFAPRYHERIHDIMHAVHDRIWWWLVSVGGSMLSISILAFIGLKTLGVHPALTLALLTGLLTFIPNFGPILSAVLPVLIGLMQSPGKAVAVIVVYVIIQFLEAHLVTPLIQRRTIRMPPILGISAQLTFSLLFGFMGLILAAPLMASLLAIMASISKDRETVAKQTVLAKPKL